MLKKIYLLLMLMLAVGLTACGGASNQAESAQSMGDVAKGKELFVTCSACHGPAGKGVAGLGKDMTASAFIKDKTDAELVEFIKVGRRTDDPLNTTKVDMPPKGGNPTLSDEDIQDIVAYIRSLQK